MFINDVKKGARLVMSGGRTGEMFDNKKGIIRMVKIDEANGYFPDIGSIYADEIISADNVPVELSAANKKRMANVRSMGF
jgi:hypothetical protein